MKHEYRDWGQRQTKTIMINSYYLITFFFFSFFEKLYFKGKRRPFDNACDQTQNSKTPPLSKKTAIQSR